MKQFYTSVLERKVDNSESFQTEPYETAWASEAIFFVRVEEVTGIDVQLQAKVQISPDGINWVDEGTEFPCIATNGIYFVKVTHFGGWLRLSSQIRGQEANFNLTIHLVLKE